MRAKCTKCGKIQYWHAYRGSHLSNSLSNCCQAPLSGMNRDNTNKNKGKTYVKCQVCGKKRLPFNLVIAQIAFHTFSGGKEYPIGTIACQWHDFIPTGKAYGDLTDEIRKMSTKRYEPTSQTLTPSQKAQGMELPFKVPSQSSDKPCPRCNCNTKSKWHENWCPLSDKNRLNDGQGSSLN